MKQNNVFGCFFLSTLKEELQNQFDGKVSCNRVKSDSLSHSTPLSLFLNYVTSMKG